MAAGSVLSKDDVVDDAEGGPRWPDAAWRMLGGRRWTRNGVEAQQRMRPANCVAARRRGMWADALARRFGNRKGGWLFPPGVGRQTDGIGSRQNAHNGVVRHGGSPADCDRDVVGVSFCV